MHQQKRIMKKTTLFLLVSLVALTTVSASANQPDDSVVVLPTYVVTAPRHQPAEQRIRRQLDELRREATTPAAIVPELNLLQARTAPAVKLAKDHRGPAMGTTAKS
jgi:hypothetical protein